jgi:hypothetical protein
MEKLTISVHPHAKQPLKKAQKNSSDHPLRQRNLAITVTVAKDAIISKILVAALSSLYFAI